MNLPKSLSKKKPQEVDNFAEEPQPAKKEIPWKPYRTVIPYGKSENVRGRFRLIFYSQEELNIVKLKDWNHKATVMGEWSPSSAGGCKQFEDTWQSNPSFKLTIPNNKEKFEMCVCLSQQKAGNDIVPFQVSSYQFFIGFYILNKLDIVFENKTWLNALDVWDTVYLNSTKENVFTIIPTTFKQGQLTSFQINVYADEEIKFVM